jgi:hypothetical protein
MRAPAAAAGLSGDPTRCAGGGQRRVGQTSRGRRDKDPGGGYGKRVRRASPSAICSSALSSRDDRPPRSGLHPNRVSGCVVAGSPTDARSISQSSIQLKLIPTNPEPRGSASLRQTPHRWAPRLVP